MLPVRVAQRFAIFTLTLSLAACTGGSVGETEQAFCDAVSRNDAAAAKAIFDRGQVKMLASNLSKSCEPGAALLDRATPASPEFTAMAVAFARQPGAANACWTSTRRNGGTTCAINAAVDKDNPAVVRALLENGASTTNNVAQRAMIDAGNTASLDVIRALVEHGADPNYGLSFAIARARTDVIEYLESKGAREDLPPLLVAARRGDLGAVDAALAAKADLAVVDGGGRTPLHRAALYGHADVVTRLARAGARLDVVTPDDFETPVHTAARVNDPNVIRALVAANAPIEARKDANSPTPLMVALQNESVAAVKVLLAAGADPNTWTESDSTAVRRAAQYGHFAIVKALLDAGARVNDAHGQGWQPLLHDVVGLCGPLPKDDPDNDYYRVTVMRALLAAGADPRAKNRDGQTPLDVATGLLAGTQEPFYRACYQAKIDLLRGR